MSKIWYGNLTNRLEENKQFCKEIKIGTGATEYHYSDRTPYEVVAVKDQKHVTIRRLDHKLKGEAYSNNWELISNEKEPTIDLVKRGDYWYTEKTATIEDLESSDFNRRLWVRMNFDCDKIKQKGKQTKYNKINISFGKAEYYYDYEF